MQVEIFDQASNLRGNDTDYILELAEFVDSKCASVATENPDMADSTQVAVLAALNIANEYLLLTKNKARKRRRQTAHP